LILASAGANGPSAEIADATRRAFARMWRAQRADGAWNWLDVGLEPFESIDSAYIGAAFAALAVGMAPAPAVEPNADGESKLHAYLSSHFAAQNLHNRAWGLLASLSLRRPLPSRDAEALLDDLQGRQREDGGWSLNGLGDWRWNRAAAPFRSPGTRDESLLAESDAYATGLIVYTLRRAGVSADRDFIKSARRWLETHQTPVRAGDQQWFAWRSYSLNYDREHGGSRGEDWRRLFMSDAATAFATLGLLASD
jgi:squalene-hopene/tetraprenyl-beta-curcumene cyclase